MFSTVNIMLSSYVERNLAFEIYCQITEARTKTYLAFRHLAK